MEILDRKKLLNDSENFSGATVELGSGRAPEFTDSIKIDMIDDDHVDIVGDAIEVIKRIPTDSVASVYARHFIEHLEDPRSLLEEILRILRPGGIIVVVVPHFSNSFYYSDPTHRQFFGLYTFAYFFRTSLFRRQVPDYAQISNGFLEAVTLGFRSYRPRFLSHGIRRCVGALVNLAPVLQEVYEESFTGFLSCYEVTYVVRKSS